MHFVSQEELKRELNEQFRATHPDLDETITLTQIRLLKAQLIRTCVSALGLEVSTLAKALVYFEKLVLERQVAKRNRKLVAATCVLLACKADGDHRRDLVSQLLLQLSAQLGISRDDIIRNEWAVFVALRFDLFLRQHEYMPHVTRILEDDVMGDLFSIREWIGERPYGVWRRSLAQADESLSDLALNDADEDEGD